MTRTAAGACLGFAMTWHGGSSYLTHTAPRLWVKIRARMRHQVQYVLHSPHTHTHHLAPHSLCGAQRGAVVAVNERQQQRVRARAAPTCCCQLHLRPPPDPRVSASSRTGAHANVSRTCGCAAMPCAAALHTKPRAGWGAVTEHGPPTPPHPLCTPSQLEQTEHSSPPQADVCDSPPFPAGPTPHPQTHTYTAPNTPAGTVSRGAGVWWRCATRASSTTACCVRTPACARASAAGTVPA